MTRPIKKTGFYQGIMEVSTTKKEEIGTLRILQDGRKFRYAKAGAGALDPGKMGVGPAADANVVNQASPVVARGESSITFTAGGAVTFAQDYFAGGYLQMNDGAAEGYQYEIESSSAVTAGTTIYITLRDPLMTALAATTELSLVASPWMAVTQTDVEENLPVGVAPMPVAIGSYYWAQTGGLVNVLTAGTPAVGSMMTLASTAGALTVVNATFDIDQPICGIAYYTAGVATEYKPVFLTLD